MNDSEHRLYFAVRLYKCARFPLAWFWCDPHSPTFSLSLPLSFHCNCWYSRMQDCLSSSRRKPRRQKHWKEPALFWHVWSHPPFTARHSSTSEQHKNTTLKHFCYKDEITFYYFFFLILSTKEVLLSSVLKWNKTTVCLWWPVQSSLEIFQNSCSLCVIKLGVQGLNIPSQLHPSGLSLYPAEQ